MTRIIAGHSGGRRLRTPAGPDTRPTSERVRESLFSVLEHRIDLEGARVLDLYAGSGALGLEAASRGAAHVVLVEASRGAARIALANARAVTPPGADVAVRAERVERVLTGAPPPVPYDLVLADPPYPLGEADLGAVLAALAGPGWLAADALVVVERSSRTPEPTWPGPPPAALVRCDRRAYGDTVLWFARLVGDEPDVIERDVIERDVIEPVP